MAGADSGSDVNNHPKPKDSDIGFISLTDDQDQRNLDIDKVSLAGEDQDTGENKNEEPPNFAVLNRF